jgi:hypothetical protein
LYVFVSPVLVPSAGLTDNQSAFIEIEYARVEQFAAEFQTVRTGLGAFLPTTVICEKLVG